MWAQSLSLSLGMKLNVTCSLSLFWQTRQRQSPNVCVCVCMPPVRLLKANQCHTSKICFTFLHSQNYFTEQPHYYLKCFYGEASSLCSVSLKIPSLSFFSKKSSYKRATRNDPISGSCDLPGTAAECSETPVRTLQQKTCNTYGMLVKSSCGADGLLAQGQSSGFAAL